MTIKVDLLPTEKKGFRIDPMVIILLLLIIAANVLFAFYGQRLTAQIEQKQQEVKKVQDEIKQVEASLPVIEEKRQRVRKLQDQIDIIKSLVHDPLRYANLLQEISLLLPTNVWLQTLSIEPGTNQVSMSGTAQEMTGRLPLATVSTLMKNFNESKYFQDATLASASQQKSDTGGKGFTFQITVRYDPKAAAELPPGGLENGRHAGQQTPAPGTAATPAPGGAPTPGAP